MVVSSGYMEHCRQSPGCASPLASLPFVFTVGILTMWIGTHAVPKLGRTVSVE